MGSRGANAGFTLLEALLATAVLALLAIPVMSAFRTAAGQDGPRVDQFEKHEFAISVLEERVAQRDFSAATGVYEDRFSYEVRVDPYQTETRTRYDDLIAHFELTITVDIVNDAGPPVAVSQIIARKAAP
ncbi:prepilin-type N-terminal cleavage/methylation domain-containing protein [Cognatiyoonia sp. IB215182]|uniref:prepilin-type N-terminal cleavage/methylation domain-containing protein n=1 Tax=Cognatiyoonia sp. IB215182 TaxID=3097353 RepID=UPI002A13A6B4|nr:prepilin-type N-terminal cleavage/methylation domain-containing protein [Cognatiyoonia sp. IB215182]MDX8355265.1 prepilin-type N-terminal cleavage/methylation domain-containing protein [Cognatiyoonia sp. IB215182]